MTDNQRGCITRLRLAGKSDGSIAHETGLTANTIKSFCQRQRIQPKVKDSGCPVPQFCAQCGQPIHDLH